MDVRDAEPAELTFCGLPVRVNDLVPPNMLMLVVPNYDRYHHLDYEATVNSSILFENVGSA